MKPLEQTIAKSEDIPLTGRGILNITDDGVDVLTYEDILKYSTLDALLGQKRAVIILYQTAQNYGHWILLMERQSSTGVEVEFFDPYGFKPDEELKYSTFNLTQHRGEAIPHLSYLLSRSLVKVTINTVQLQGFSRHVNTCGRWCAVRFVYRDLSLTSFIMMFDNKVYTPDWFVSALTLIKE